MVAKNAVYQLPQDLPLLPTNWEYKPLGDLVEHRGICYGIVQPGKEIPDGVPIVRVNNVRQGRIDTSDVKCVEPIIADGFARSRLCGGEVLLTLVGTLGEVAIVPQKLAGWNVARAVGVIPVSEHIGNLWISLCLRSEFIQRYIGMWATTTVQATFNLRDVARLPIPIPPKCEREAIASILGSLDDKIELNRRMNETLEGIARALFKSWFVDFDPVRAKMDGRQPAGMSPEIANLFPSEFEHVNGELVPKGWDIVTLGKLAQNVSITYDFTKSKDVVFINTGDVFDGDFLHSKRSVKSELPGQAKKRIQPNDCLFTEIRPANKRFAFVDFDSSEYVVSTKFMIVRSQGLIHPRLLYRNITSDAALQEFQMIAESRSGTFPQITFDSVSHYPITLPTTKVQEVYQQQVDPLDELIKSNKLESTKLSTLRDTLLPKLLSGELRVPEADKLLEEVL